VPDGKTLLVTDVVADVVPHFDDCGIQNSDATLDLSSLAAYTSSTRGPRTNPCGVAVSSTPFHHHDRFGTAIGVSGGTVLSASLNSGRANFLVLGYLE
jgi:hypothetical protein